MTKPEANPSRRGGKRPGAGAPKGNLNALKHGSRSRQMAELGAALATNPEARAALNRLAAEYALREGDIGLAFDIDLPTVMVDKKTAANINRRVRRERSTA